MRIGGDGVELWGHRGWAGRHPHNSMVGFGAAFGVVPCVEIDVRKTRDGRLVLSHDPMIGDLTIAGADWATVRDLDLGGGQRPVLLEEALQAFPDRMFDIEVKNHPGEPGYDESGSVAVETAALARRRDIVTSFYWPSLDRVRREMGTDGPPTGLLLDEPVPFDAAMGHALEGGHDAVVPSWRLLDGPGAGSLVHAARAAGLVVVVWTVNEVDRAIRLAELGVGAIITDDPGRMHSALAR